MKEVTYVGIVKGNDETYENHGDTKSAVATGGPTKRENVWV